MRRSSRAGGWAPSTSSARTATTRARSRWKELHRLTARNMDKLAGAVEACVEVYFAGQEADGKQLPTAFDSSPNGVASAGLLGMNRGALSFVSHASTRRFSYCISDRDHAGVLLLGHSDLPHFLPLNYTPLYQPALPLPYFDRVAYSVQLLGIRVGAKHLPIPASVLAPDHTGAGQTMVDSGTQFTFLLGDAYSALKAEFLRQSRPLLPALDDPGFAFQEAFDTCFRVPRPVAAGCSASRSRLSRAHSPPLAVAELALDELYGRGAEWPTALLLTEPALDELDAPDDQGRELRACCWTFCGRWRRALSTRESPPAGRL